MTRSNLYQRLFAGLWLLACVGLAVAGWRYQAPFSYDRPITRAQFQKNNKDYSNSSIGSNTNDFLFFFKVSILLLLHTT